MVPFTVGGVAATDGVESGGMDDPQRRFLLRNSHKALDKLAEAIAHIRGCTRCERVFTIAYEAHVENQVAEAERSGFGRGFKYPPLYPGKVWSIFGNELLREFRRCENWPTEISL